MSEVTSLEELTANFRIVQQNVVKEIEVQQRKLADAAKIIAKKIGDMCKGYDYMKGEEENYFDLDDPSQKQHSVVVYKRVHEPNFPNPHIYTEIIDKYISENFTNPRPELRGMLLCMMEVKEPAYCCFKCKKIIPKDLSGGIIKPPITIDCVWGNYQGAICIYCDKDTKVRFESLRDPQSIPLSRSITDLEEMEPIAPKQALPPKKRKSLEVERIRTSLRWKEPSKKKKSPPKKPRKRLDQEGRMRAPEWCAKCGKKPPQKGHNKEGFPLRMCWNCDQFRDFRDIL